MQFVFKGGGGINIYSITENALFVMGGLYHLFLLIDAIIKSVKIVIINGWFEIIHVPVVENLYYIIRIIWKQTEDGDPYKRRGRGQHT